MAFYKDQRSTEFDKKRLTLDTLLYLMTNFVSKHEIEDRQEFYSCGIMMQEESWKPLDNH